jgi:hypothetical protein
MALAHREIPGFEDRSRSGLPCCVGVSCEFNTGPAAAGVGMTDSTNWMTQDPGDEVAPVDLHTDRPHPARVYDYLLGGKDNFAADRQAAEEALAVNPTGRAGPVENRAFMIRAVRYLAAEAGIRQFLDIGTGIPTSPNVHEVAQSVAPAARIAYADNDPVVLSHARALMSSTPEGKTLYVDGDMREPDSILSDHALSEVIEPSRPVGLLLIAVMHLIRDLDEAYGYCRQYVAALPPGSFLVLTHLTDDLAPERLRGVSESMRQRGMTLVPRGKTQIERFFDGLDLVEPGIQIVNRWRPDAGIARGSDPGYDADVSIYGGVARKPGP